MMDYDEYESCEEENDGPLPTASLFARPENFPKLSSDEVKKVFSGSNHLKAPLSALKKADIKGIKKIINPEFTEILLNGIRYGYKTCCDGLLVWLGSFLTRTKQIIISWEDAHRLLSEMSLEDTVKDGQQLSFFDFI